MCIEWNTLEQRGAGHGVSSKRNLSRWDSIPPQGLRFFSFCEHVVKFNSLSVKTAASWKHREEWKIWALWRASICVCVWFFLDSLYQPLAKGRGAQVVGNLLILLFKNVMSGLTFWWACCILYLLFIYGDRGKKSPKPGSLHLFQVQRVPQSPRRVPPSPHSKLGALGPCTGPFHWRAIGIKRDVGVS